MVKGGTSADWVRWTFVLGSAIWVGIALMRGLIGKPGPKLSPKVRTAYPWMHRALYGVIALSALLNAAELLGWLAPGLAWTSLLILLAMGSFHGIFQFWRHTALYDNALRVITSRFLHGIL